MSYYYLTDKKNLHGIAKQIDYGILTQMLPCLQVGQMLHKVQNLELPNRAELPKESLSIN